MALQSDNAEPLRTENLRRFQHQQAPCFSEATEKVPITAFLSIFSVTLFKNYRKRTLKILRSEVFQWPPG